MDFFGYLIEVIRTGHSPRGDGWFGLAFVAIVFLLIAGYWVWEIKEAAKARQKE